MKKLNSVCKISSYFHTVVAWYSLKNSFMFKKMSESQVDWNNIEKEKIQSSIFNYIPLELLELRHLLCLCTHR